MEIKLYSIKDTVAGVFGTPFLASSVGLAVRQFRYMMKNAPMVANDCALYCLGGYEQETGVITPEVTFIENYTEVNDNG